jgi:hypothetical protein
VTKDISLPRISAENMADKGFLGNYYSIVNDYDEHARLFFSQGCEVAPPPEPEEEEEVEEEEDVEEDEVEEEDEEGA